MFGTNVDVGKGISDLLVQQLVTDGKYSMIERNAIDKILGEQNFGNSDRVDAANCRQNRESSRRRCSCHGQHHAIWA